MGVSDERARWLAVEVMPHEPAVRAWLRRGRRSEPDIDDIIQDTYARLVRVPDTDAIRNVRAYFFRAAHSAVVDQVRRQSVIAIDAVADIDRLQVPDGEADPNGVLTARGRRNSWARRRSRARS